MERIGVIGQPLGGSAALGVGRTRDDTGAVIAVEAPYMADIEGVHDGEFAWTDDPYPVPVLNIYSDRAWPHLSERPQYARNQQQLTAPAAAGFNVHIAGVGHLGLTDLSLSSPLLTRLLDGQAPAIDPREALEELRRTSLDFLDSHLTSPASS